MPKAVRATEKAAALAGGGGLERARSWLRSMRGRCRWYPNEETARKFPLSTGDAG